MTAERADNLIVGAGPAGLAAAACLRRAGAEYVVLERAEEVGSSWRSHYERLHLHTSASHSHLPFVPFPDIYPTFPSREQIVEYLDDYARRFEIEPRLGVRVTRGERRGGLWRVETSAGDWEAKRLIVATGYNGVPHRPRYDGDEDFGGSILHSKEYFSGTSFSGQRVLVVGSGNSGAEIAIDLFECGAKPLICIRGPVHVQSREFMGVPAQVFGLMLAKLPLKVADRIALTVSKIAFPDLAELGIRRPTKGPISMLTEDGRVPMIDIGTIDLIRQGAISVVPGIERFDTDGASFADGCYEKLDAVVLATGYRPALGWLKTKVLNERGLPTTFRGEAAPGLYFIGFRNPPTGALWDIAQEAEAVAAHITERN